MPVVKIETNQEDMLNIQKEEIEKGRILFLVQENEMGLFLHFADNEEEIPKEYKTTPYQPTETELLGQQMVEKDLRLLELQQENQSLGQQLVDIDLRLLQGGL